MQTLDGSSGESIALVELLGMLKPQNPARKRIGSVAFSVSARLALQLGRESISNSTTAIIELVKNAYDADAEHVRIEFHNLGGNDPIMVIEDDGCGMVFNELRRNWLMIGTSNKLTACTSPKKGRILTGEKGLGRLGLDRLCRKTIVQFFSDEKEHGVELVLDWSKYERRDLRLERVKHQCFSIAKSVAHPVSGKMRTIAHGTRLVLSGLKDPWTPKQLADLRQELLLLISPFAGIRDFSITLESGLSRPEIDGPISSTRMLAGAEWRLVARIDAGNRVRYLVTSRLHNRSFRLGPVRWCEKIHQRGKAPECGPLRFEMYYFSRLRDVLSQLDFQSRKINRFLESNQGIRIYRDGFRVKPYGEPSGEGDWLTLSWRRQQSPEGVRGETGAWRVGYNQVVGAVFLQREKNPNLVDQTNREGIVEHKAYYDLRAFALDAIRYFETSRQEFECTQHPQPECGLAEEAARRATESSAKAMANMRQTQAEIQRLVSGVNKDISAHDISSAKELFSEATKRVADSLQDVKRAQVDMEKELRRTKDTLSNLASLGILTACFGHETLGSSNIVLVNATELKKKLIRCNSSADGKSTSCEENVDLIIDGVGKIRTFADFALGNVKRDKRRRRNLDLQKIAGTVFASFKPFLDDKKIDATVSPVDSLPLVRGFEIDWESIFVNLLTNAVWAIVENPEGPVRKIRIRFRETKTHLHVIFSDSGKGLEKGTEGKIFLATYSTKRNPKGDVIGTGMGLTIVKSFVDDSIRGSIEAKSHGSLGGAEFTIRVPVQGSSSRGDD